LLPSFANSAKSSRKQEKEGRQLLGLGVWGKAVANSFAQRKKSKKLPLRKK
tara:strand:+ start:290 stop:442 length:153 start_codon:yes stop_codon:yes gene_type:complete